MQWHLSAEHGQVPVLFIIFLYFRNNWDCLPTVRVLYWWRLWKHAEPLPAHRVNIIMEEKTA